MTGKRLAALMALRDKARRVLQSQNEGWPEANRNEARRELNWAYDLFANRYGPINKKLQDDRKGQLFMNWCDGRSSGRGSFCWIKNVTPYRYTSPTIFQLVSQ
jgi:hypothetical protein